MILKAQIIDTVLGIENHGIFTFYFKILTRDYATTVGNFSLSFYDRYLAKEVFNKNGLEAVAKILDVVGVDSWEKLRGQHIRVVEEDFGEPIVKIGNFAKDKWVDLREVISQQ